MSREYENTYYKMKFTLKHKQKYESKANEVTQKWLDGKEMSATRERVRSRRGTKKWENSKKQNDWDLSTVDQKSLRRSSLFAESTWFEIY